MKKKRTYKHRPYEAIADLRYTSADKKRHVIELYKKGISQVQIETSLHMTRKTIRSTLKEAGVYRTKSQQWRMRYGTTLKEDAFDILTPEALYWIGFLYADGHILGKRGYNIELGVHSQDEDHLRKYLIYLGSNNPILSESRSSKYLRVRIGSQKLHGLLQSFGFNNQKSLTATPHELLKDSREFWRGVIDGDGCLQWVKSRNYSMISLCGTPETVKGFIAFLQNNGIETKAKGNRAYGKNLYQVNFAAKKAKAVADLLYKDAIVYLDRKYKIYLEHFAEKQ